MKLRVSKSGSDALLGLTASAALLAVFVMANPGAALACPMGAKDDVRAETAPLVVAESDAQMDEEIMDEAEDPMEGVEEDVMGDGGDDDMFDDEAGADMDGADLPSEGETMD